MARLANLTSNWPLKLAALALAFLLWAIVRAEAASRMTVRDVAVEVSLHDPAWFLTGSPVPDTVSVTLTGPLREVLAAMQRRPRLVVPIEEVTARNAIVPVRASWVRIDAGNPRVRVEDVAPSTIRLRFEPTASKSVPVVLTTRGSLPTGFSLAAPAHVDPRTVTLHGPMQRLRGLERVPTLPIDFAGRKSPESFVVGLDTAVLRGVRVVPAEVEVFLPIMRAPAVPDAMRAPDSVRR